MTNEQIDMLENEFRRIGSAGHWNQYVAVEALLLCAQAKRANLGVVAEPVAWAVVNLDGEIDALEIKKPEVIVGYARPLTWASPTP